MAFDGAYLSCHESNVMGNAGRRVWYYTTTDNAAAIAGTGYFVNCGIDNDVNGAYGMEVGDVICVTVVTALPHTTPLGINWYVVSAVDSDGDCTAIKTATA